MKLRRWAITALVIFLCYVAVALPLGTALFVAGKMLGGSIGLWPWIGATSVVVAELGLLSFFFMWIADRVD